MKARFTGRVWKEVLCAVLKVCQIFVYFEIGDWSNGMTGVSKTLSGSSILSSPVIESLGNRVERGFLRFFFLQREER